MVLGRQCISRSLSKYRLECSKNRQTSVLKGLPLKTDVLGFAGWASDARFRNSNGPWFWGGDVWANFSTTGNTLYIWDVSTSKFCVFCLEKLTFYALQAPQSASWGQETPTFAVTAFHQPEQFGAGFYGQQVRRVNFNVFLKPAFCT